MRWILGAGLAFALSALVATAATAEPVRARLESGVIVGERADGVAVFRGVPYAQPPVGRLRWAPPMGPNPWAGERLTTQAGPACVQPPRTGGVLAGGVASDTSEDCLTLQVFAPAKATKAPVMVWLHGGGNTGGAGSLGVYDGSAFARDGVILVSINYRLGALGFFAHPALTKAAGADEPLANYGLMDQIAALRWVQRNIEAFGGDPANVTVFGESAGGQDTLALLTIPSARGLFAKAIVESGVGWERPVSLAAAEQKGQALMTRLGLPPNASAAELRAVPAASITALQGKVSRVVDGRLLVEDVRTAFAQGRASDVPLIVGSNSYEASLIASDPEEAKAYLAAVPPALRAVYEKPGQDDKALTIALYTDGVMGGPARWIANKTSGGAPSWLYYFSYVLDPFRGHTPGAAHGFEIPFVFDTWDKLGALSLGYKPSAETRALTAMVHGCWVSFAKTGTLACPTPQVWRPYTPQTDSLMEFGAPSGERVNFRKVELDAQVAARTDLPK